MEHKTDRPTVEQIDREIRRRKRRSQTHRILRSTLFTCNTGGQTRCAVRCIRAEELK
ncbi:MAG: hypothetical protein IJQ36_02320 [Oscillospiraceae bacterium]|nr:hypothetical protein [Oscillospiraceae bacterium]